MKRSTLLKTCALLILLSLSLVIVMGCSGAGSVEAPESTDVSTTTQATKATLQKTQTAAASEPEGPVVKLSGNYSYTAPGDYEKATDDFDSRAVETNCYVSKDGKRKVRSWMIDGGFAFPEDADGMAAERGAEIGYDTFFSTAIAELTDERTEDGSSVYRTLYIWPDGPDQVCFLEITSTGMKSPNLVSRVKGSVTKTGEGPWTGPAEGGSGGNGTPSGEEVDNAMLQDGQDAYDQDANEQTDWGGFYSPY